MDGILVHVGTHESKHVIIGEGLRSYVRYAGDIFGGGGADVHFVKRREALKKFLILE